MIAQKIKSRQQHYGLRPDTQQALLAFQGYGCGICTRSFTECAEQIDHNHATKKVRGYLCAKCNARVASLENYTLAVTTPTEWLERAYAYLDNPPYQQLRAIKYGVRT